MLKIIITIMVSLSFSFSVLAEQQSSELERHRIHHPVWPMILGAGLITWGAYELGDDSEEGERNIAIMWGGAALASAAIVLYQSSRNKDTAVYFQPSLNESYSIVVNHRF